MRPTRSELLRGAGLLAATGALALAFIGSYLGALHAPSPRGVPVAVAGPAQLVGAIEAGGAFAAVAKPDAAAVRRAIDQREVDGGVIAGSGGVQVLAVPAASPIEAQLLAEQVAPKLRQGGQKVTVETVHALPAADPRGLSPFYAVVGWLVAGYLGATVLGLTFGSLAAGPRRALWRLGALAVYALLIGLLGAAVATAISLPANLFAAALVGFGVVFAAGAMTAGLQSALGLVGTGIAILLLVVLGNPSASGAAATHLLPQPWAFLGPLTPAGAGTEALRNVSYFDRNGLLGPIVVLLVWVGVGAALTIGLSRRNRGRSPAAVEAEALAGVAAA